MYTNTSCTIYSPALNGAYIRSVCPAVFWEETIGYNVQKFGEANANKATVFIPLSADIEPKKGDFIVKGTLELVIDGVLHKSNELLTNGALRIITACKNDFGSADLHHWELGLK